MGGVWSFRGVFGAFIPVIQKNWDILTLQGAKLMYCYTYMEMNLLNPSQECI